MLFIRIFPIFCFFMLTQQTRGREAAGIYSFRREFINSTILAIDSVVPEKGRPRLAYVKSERDFVASKEGKPVLALALDIYDENLTYHKSCWTNLTVEGKQHVGVGILNADRLVLTWAETVGTSMLQVYLVDLEKCQWKNITRITVNAPVLKSTVRNPFVITYEEGFDVLFSNMDICKKRLCKVSFDSKGSVIGELVALQDDSYDPSLSKPGFSHSPHFGVISRNSMAKGYFMFVEEDEVLKIKILNSKGQVINSKTAHIDPRITGDNGTFIASNSYETFGYCWIVTTNNSIHCYQYDAHLNLKSNITWTIGYYATQAWMFNLKDGEFILLIKDQRMSNYYLTLVDKHGIRSDALELGNHCDPTLLFDWEHLNWGDFYCSYDMCLNNLSKVSVDLRCVPSMYPHQSVRDKGDAKKYFD